MSPFIRALLVSALSFYACSAHASESIYKFSKNANYRSLDELRADPSTREVDAGVEYLQSRGLVSPRIVGGTQAGQNEYPEYVQLLVDGSVIPNGDPNSLYAICGATLIGTNHLLTAAHCTEGFNVSNLYAYVGFYSRAAFSFSNVDRIVLKSEHPDYNTTTLRDDISILFTLGRYSSPAKIHEGSHKLVDRLSTVIGTGLTSTGGASASALRKVNVPIISNKICRASYGGSTITNNMICAGYASGGKDSCNGDSGGPLWTTIDNQKVQTGIVSFGTAVCARANFYGVYTRVSKYKSFIKQYVPNARFVTLDDFSAASIVPPIFLLLQDD